MKKQLTKDYLDQLTYEVIGAAIEVHREMGPGLLESVYEACMVHELELRGIKATQQQRVPVNYKGKIVNADLRCDLLVEDCLVVELKAVLEMLPIFEAQVMTYSKLLKVPKALLINFTCENIVRQGQKTFVNEYFRLLPEE